MHNDVYRTAHPEEARMYREAHREEKRIYTRAYYATHREEERARLRTYCRSHKARVNAWGAERRVIRLRQTLKSANLKEIEAFYAEADRLTKKTGIKYSVDHVIPLNGKLVSGLHVPWNLQIMTLSDNSKKGNR